MSNIIEFKDVSFSYVNKKGKREQLFHELSLGIEKGTFTAVLGSSGSGKTTLLNLIAGFLRPQTGSISVEGTVVSDMSSDEACDYRNRRIGFIYQSFNLLPEITAQQNVMLPLIIAHKADAELRSSQALALLGLADRADYLPTKMSGGEQQRTAIARAIVNDADIILADEPTGNLDKENADAVKDILRDLADKGKTVIAVTHDRSFSEVTDSIINLSELKG